MMMTIAITATIAINGSAAVRNTTQSCRNDTKAFHPVDNAPLMRSPSDTVSSRRSGWASSFSVTRTVASFTCWSVSAKVLSSCSMLYCVSASCVSSASKSDKSPAVSVSACKRASSSF